MGLREAERWTERGYSNLEPTEPPGAGRAVILVLAGMVIGAGAALLLAPKTGSELRQAIERGCRRTWEELSGRAHDLRDRAQNIGEDLHEHFPNLLRFSRRTRRRVPDAGV